MARRLTIFSNQFLTYKKFRISSVRKVGDNFDFFLSRGDWQEGDKEMSKITVSGKSFKVMMATRNSPFKESLASYF